MPKDFRATMLERAIGRTIAAWRRMRDMSLFEAGRRVGFSSAKLSLMENAIQPSAPVDVMALGYTYGVPTPEWQELVRHTEWAERLRRPAHSIVRFDAVADFAHLGAEATRLRVFRCDVLPTVFQTGDYARAVAAQRPSVWQTDLQVEAVLTEAVIRQLVGGPQVMKAQLLHLMELSELPTVTMQIITCDAGAYPAMGSPFTLLSFPHRQHDDVVYLEHFLRGEYLEDQRDRGLCADRFAALQRLALPPADSVELIAERVSTLSDLA